MIFGGLATFPHKTSFRWLERAFAGNLPADPWESGFHPEIQTNAWEFEVGQVGENYLN